MLERGLLATAPAKPGLWHRRGWGRPEAFVRAAAAGRASRAGELPARPGPVAGVVSDRVAADHALARRSVRRFTPEPLPSPVQREVLAAASAVALRAWPHLRLYVAVQDVAGIERGVHAYDPRYDLLTLRRPGLDETRLKDCAHQYWVLGSGAALFFSVNWQALEQAHGPGPDAYATVLSECGRAAHTAVLAAGRMRAGTWMPPAIDEHLAAELCGLDDSEETLHMLKVGMPRDTGEGLR